MKKLIVFFITTFFATTVNAQFPFNDFVLVEGGTFHMGAQKSNPDAPNYDTLAIERYYDGTEWGDWEAPVHQVTLSSFWIGKYEATHAEWLLITGESTSANSNIANKPVETINYQNIQAFISALNSMQSQYVYRLPTEAEWEFAARGGNQSMGYIYSGSNEVNDVSWFGGVDGNSGNNTHAVGSKIPNELGIYDMSGNVDEYCSDLFGSYSADPQTNPTGNPSGTERMIRGGSWFHASKISRVADRTKRPNNSPKYSTDGFRLVRSEISTNNVPVTSVSLNKIETTIDLRTSNNEQLTATISPSNASNKLVYWQSSDKSIASVDNTGKIVCYQRGECTITATTVDGQKTAICDVTVTNTTNFNENNTAPVDIYPNPVDYELRISNCQLRDENVMTLTDVSGRQVNNCTLQIVGNDAVMDVSSLSQGIYIIKIQTDSGQIVRKFVKK
jgi:formylglycine-generating enzyme required for sulfatase activity